MTIGSATGKNMALDACYGSNHASMWPATVYAHLYSGDPTSGGAELSAAGGYAPVAVTNNTTNFPNATGGQKTTGADIVFPTSTGAWSNVATYFWFTDALGCSAPGPLTVTNVGTAGTTTWSYQVTATNAAGETTGSPTGSTTTGNATLTVGNYNTVAWSAVSGATGYRVYKVVSGVWKLLTTTVSTSVNDTGGSTSTGTPPVTNTTVNLLDGGPLPSAAPVIVTEAAVVARIPAGAIVIGD